jgi:hypothetical protein
MNNDRTLINLLSGQSTSQGATSSSGFTVFIPSNEAFAQNNVPRDPDQLNNDVRNFIVKGFFMFIYIKFYFCFVVFLHINLFKRYFNIGPSSSNEWPQYNKNIWLQTHADDASS